jgi:hypothetical protein
MVTRPILVLLLLVAAAGGGDSDQVTATATVLKVVRDQPDGIPDAIEVERDRDKGKLELIVTAKTKIEKTVGKERRACALVDLRPGDRVEASYHPILQASCPPVTVAFRLVLLPPDKK